MTTNKLTIKVTVIIGGKSFDCDLFQEMKGLDDKNPINFLKIYIAQTAKDPEILNALAQDEKYRKELAYNENIGSNLADCLAFELDNQTDGFYSEEYYALLSNQRLSEDMLDLLANKHLARYRDGSIKWYSDPDMLKSIAKNPSTGQSTLHLLQSCGIPKVEEVVRERF